MKAMKARLAPPMTWRLNVGSEDKWTTTAAICPLAVWHSSKTHLNRHDRADALRQRSISMPAAGESARGNGRASCAQIPFRGLISEASALLRMWIEEDETHVEHPGGDSAGAVAA